MKRQFVKYIEEHHLLKHDDKIMVAVSGGADSMVMLSMLAECGYRVAVAHCNFSLRGEESDGDSELVERECRRLGVDLHLKKFDTKAEMERTGDGVQVAARRLRYEWFDELCWEYGYEKIVVAHHLDDSIETFFINLIRGTGIRGLAGIAAERDRVIRPMLFATRQEIEQYATERGITYRDDSSNRSTEYLRNKIRLEVVPKLIEVSPSFRETMSANIVRVDEAARFVDVAIDDIRRQTQRENDGLICIDPDKIGRDYDTVFVLYELLRMYGFNRQQVESIAIALSDELSGVMIYSKDFAASTDRGSILIKPFAEESHISASIQEDQSEVVFRDLTITIEYLNMDQIDSLKLPPDVALIDRSKLAYPLTIRSWREGDRIVPLGMDGSKKVSDILIDTKVPRTVKSEKFVICSEEDIIWLGGHCINEHYKITPQTERVVRFTILR